MPPIMPITGLNRNLNVQDRATRNMAQIQDAVLGIRVPGGPRGTMREFAASAAQSGISRAFFPFWIESIKSFFQQLKSMNSLAFGS